MYRKRLNEKGEKEFFFGKKSLSLLSGFIFFVFLMSNSGTAFGIPSFARQTGLSCSACHTVFPQLTAFGRQFKLDGYTMTNIKTIKSTEKKSDGKDRTMLKLLSKAPLSAMVESGITFVNKPDGAQNGTVEFPQQFSLFYGGQITPHMGAFIQLTNEDGPDGGSFGLDLVDIRYARQGTGSTPLTYGLTLNNGPTVQDLWNNTPVWGFPYSASGVAADPGVSAFIENGPDIGAAGLGAYALVNNLIYVEFSAYRSAQLGVDLPLNSGSAGVLKGIAPYWRLALQHTFNKSYLEVGTFGIAAKVFPLGVSGLTDNYTDMGLDLQYEYQMAKGQFTLHSSFINEKQSLNSTFNDGGSDNLANTLNVFKVDGSLFFKPGINLTLGYFNVTGSKDAGLWGADYTGNVPNNSGLRAQISLLPWENTKVSMQYVAFNKFNGETTGASDNNSIYFQLWFLF